MILDLVFVNKLVSVKNDSVNVRSKAGTSFSIVTNISKGSTIGRTSGLKEVKADGTWLEVNLQTSVNNISYGWIRSDVVNLSIPASNTTAAANAQTMVNGLLKNDFEVFKSLVKCANLILALQRRNVNVTQHKSILRTLAINLHARQNILISSNFAQRYQTGYPQKYARLIDGYKNLLTSIEGIGIAPIVVIIIIFALGAASAVGAYYAFKPRYDESKRDLRVSTELESVLSQLAPEARAEIERDLEEQIDNAYNSGNTSGTFSGMFNVIKPFLFAGLGFIVVTKFINSQNKRK